MRERGMEGRWGFVGRRGESRRRRWRRKKGKYLLEKVKIGIGMRNEKQGLSVKVSE